MIFFKKKPDIDLDIEPPTVKTGNVRAREQYEKFPNKFKKIIKKSPEKVFLITMFYLNGTIKEYVINTPEKLFELGKNKHYLLISENARFNLTMKMNQLFYVEDTPVPINKEFLKEEHKKDNSKDNVFMSLTPSNLKEFISMKFVEKVINPIDIAKWLKLAFFSGLGACIFSLINIVLSSGVVTGG